MSNCHSSWPPHHPLITPCPLVPVPVSTATHLSAPVTSDHCPPRPATFHKLLEQTPAVATETGHLPSNLHTPPPLQHGVQPLNRYNMDK